MILGASKSEELVINLEWTKNAVHVLYTHSFKYIKVNSKNDTKLLDWKTTITA